VRIPLFIEFGGKRVLVLGGGYTATKRAEKFLAAGSFVTVIAMEVSSDLMKLRSNGNMDILMGDLRLLDVDFIMHGFDLVVYAVPDEELRIRIKRAASRNRILFNDATDSIGTEVVVPFDGDYMGVRIAVTTEGKSGVAARAVRDYLIDTLSSSPDMGNFISVWYMVKEKIKSSVDSPGKRMRIYMRLRDDESFKSLARSGNVEDAMRYVEEVIRNG